MPNWKSEMPDDHSPAFVVVSDGKGELTGLIGRYSDGSYRVEIPGMSVKVNGEATVERALEELDLPKDGWNYGWHSFGQKGK